MKKIKRWFSEMFGHEEMNDLDLASIADAFNDTEVRQYWLLWMVEEIKNMNLEVDKRLLSGSEAGFIDLCSRRKTIQDVLNAVLSAKVRVKRGERLNPRSMVGGIDLDRVTV